LKHLEQHPQSLLMWVIDCVYSDEQIGFRFCTSFYSQRTVHLDKGLSYLVLVHCKGAA
jgi:hypothetical protein